MIPLPGFRAVSFRPLAPLLLAISIAVLFPAGEVGAVPQFRSTFQSYLMKPFSYGALALGDLNGDGRPDLVTACSQNAISARLAQGGETFGPEIDSAVPDPNTQFVEIADLNGDGKADLVI